MHYQKLALLGLVTSVLLCAFVEAEARVGAQAGNALTVIYNHEGTASATGLEKEGGLAIHIQLEERALLFDTGGEAGVIQENLQSLGLNDAELEGVVLSHNHWDHVYGLPGAMRSVRNAPPVYVSASDAIGLKQQFPRATVVAVEGPMRIAPEIWLTGPLETEFIGAPLSEQALVIERQDGLYIIAGCSHPGIVAIVERVIDMFPNRAIALVAGGFHLRSRSQAEIREIAATLK